MIMAREEVKYASKDYVNYLLDKQEYHNEKYTEYDIKQAFEKGAEWADEHSINFWHNAGEEPKKNSKIAIVDTEGRWLIVEYDVSGSWKFCIEYFNLKIWAYIDELLPKECKK